MNLKLNLQNSKFKTVLLLLLWMAIGMGLRFTQLTGKSPWTDEFATMVFGLGNSYKNIPLDRVIPLEVLMQPLRPDAAASASTVIHHLLTEDVHPPVYFVLLHWWMNLFSPARDGYVSLWGARSLPALLGVMSIPAIYGISRLAFRSSLVGHLAAAMMAVSPYGIFLAQEARHYTLAILFVIASLCCLVIAARYLYGQKTIPIGIVLLWVASNTLGLATHYFFILTLLAEAIALLGLGWQQFKIQGKKFTFRPWWRVVAVAIGTAAGGMVWVFQWLQTHDTGVSSWIRQSDRGLLQWLNPIFQSLATWIPMIHLMPVEAPALPVVILSGVAMLIFFIWVTPILYRGIKTQWQQPDTRLETGILGGTVLGAIAIFLIITYAFAYDLTRAARYSFVYFPAVIVLVGASLAVCWNTPQVKTPRLGIKKLSFPISGKQAVAAILIMGFLSGLTVVSNLGYRKYYRPDQLVPVVQETSSVPVLIATTHNSLVQTGEIMGIAWEMKKSPNLQTSLNPQFLLAHQDQVLCEGSACPTSQRLQQAVAQLPKPLDLWAVNFYAPIELDAQQCIADNRSFPSIYGYGYSLYHCRSTIN